MRAAIALSLDFWTWRRLAGEGMSDAEATALMVDAVQAASSVVRMAGPRRTEASFTFDACKPSGNPPGTVGVDEA